MSDVITLFPSERVEIDHRRLLQLGHQIAPREAELRLGSVLEELAYWLYHLDRSRHRLDPVACAGQCRRIAELAGVAGLVSVDRIARMLADPDGHRDGAARAALAARLVRTGEASILEIWDLQDQSL